MDAERGQRIVGRRREEVEVLEEPEQPEIRRHAEREEAPPPRPVRQRMQSQRDDVLEERREPQQPEEPPVPPRVEQVARDQGDHQPQAPVRRVVRRHEEREEDHEGKRVEEHGGVSRSSTGAPFRCRDEPCGPFRGSHTEQPSHSPCTVRWSRRRRPEALLGCTRVRAPFNPIE